MYLVCTTPRPIASTILVAHVHGAGAVNVYDQVNVVVNVNVVVVVNETGVQRVSTTAARRVAVLPSGRLDHENRSTCPFAREAYPWVEST